VTGGRVGTLAAGAAGLLLLLPLTLLVVLLPAATAVITTGGGPVGAAATARLPGGVPAGMAPLLRRAGGSCRLVTPALLAGQIEVESGWNPAAVSPAGAAGLAQFTPATWASWGADGDGDGRRDPFSPADAITAQAHYLCQLLAAVTARGLAGDPLDLALAAYNAGLPAVLAAQGVPAFAETRAYVPRVRAAAARYAHPDRPGAAGPAGSPGALAGATTTGGWVSPCPGPVTSGFGPRADGFHPGIDLGVPVGTPVLAAHKGRVLAAGPADGFGQWVVLDHGGVQTVYGHLSAETVTVGQTVTTGQQIAVSGDTGQSTGPHLHFEVHVSGHPVDPVAVYAGLGLPLP